MGPLDSLNHLVNFVAPALVMAFLLVFFPRIVLKKKVKALAWWVQVAITFAAGSAALLLGLLAFGPDGKMASYAMLVLACATSQWAIGFRRKR